MSDVAALGAETNEEKTVENVFFLPTTIVLSRYYARLYSICQLPMYPSLYIA